jgi:hypothetical protein
VGVINFNIIRKIDIKLKKAIKTKTPQKQCASLYISSTQSMPLKEFKRWIKERIPVGAKNITMKTEYEYSCFDDGIISSCIKFCWEI